MYCKVPRNRGGRRCEVKVTIRMAKRKKTSRRGWTGEDKASYLSRQFDKVCEGKMTMEDYNELRKEVMKDGK